RTLNNRLAILSWYALYALGFLAFLAAFAVSSTNSLSVKSLAISLGTLDSNPAFAKEAAIIAGLPVEIALKTWDAMAPATPMSNALVADLDGLANLADALARSEEYFRMS